MIEGALSSLQTAVGGRARPLWTVAQVHMHLILFRTAPSFLWSSYLEFVWDKLSFLLIEELTRQACEPYLCPLAAGCAVYY